MGESLSRRSNGRQGPPQAAARRRAIFGHYSGTACFLGHFPRRLPDAAATIAEAYPKSRGKSRGAPARRNLA
jgi:hypothetical protein